MHTRIKDFAEKFTSYVKKLPQNNDGFSSLVRLESVISIKLLNDRLKASWNDESLLSDISLSTFKLFLSSRWQCISNTQASYFRSPDSKINRVCIELAKVISKVTSQPIDKILMPSLKNGDTCFFNDDSSSRLHEFVVGDQCQLISVMACIDGYRLYNKLSNTNSENMDNLLSPQERDKIIFHSNEARAYYDAIRLGCDEDQIDQAREQLVKLLNSDHPELSILATDIESYAESSLISFIRSQTNSMNRLLTMMCQYVPRSEWCLFIRKYSSENFVQLFYDASDSDLIRSPSLRGFKNKLTGRFNALPRSLNQPHISESLKELKTSAFCLCVLEACYRIREQGADFHSYSGQLLSWLPNTGVYSKEQKLDAITALMKFFETNKSMIEIRFYLNSDEMQPHVGPLTSGELSWVTEKIESLAQHFQKKVPEVVEPDLGFAIKK